MFNILRTKVKTKLEMQVEEYVEYKARTSPFIAEDQKIILEGFIKEINRTNISEITLQELDAYYLKISVGQTNWRTVNITKAIRAFIRFHKRYTTIKPRQITDMGIKQIKPSLQSVAENAIIEPMTKRKKVGRPPNVAFIKEIKRLVDKGGLGIREIARAKLINPGNVSRAYNYDLSKII